MSVKNQDDVVVQSSPGKVTFPRLELEKIMGAERRPDLNHNLRQSQEPSRNSSLNPKYILKNSQS